MNSLITALARQRNIVKSLILPVARQRNIKINLDLYWFYMLYYNINKETTISYSPLNTKNRIALVVDTHRVPLFFKKYPKIEKTMLEYVGSTKSTINNYIHWLNKYGADGYMLGGYPETVRSKSFGTKTFYKFDWDGISGYAELFQYLTDENKS